MAFSGIRIHQNPTFYGSGNITSSGAWSLTVTIDSSSIAYGAWYAYKMTFYAVYNDGTYEELTHIGNNSTNIYQSGASWNLSGQLKNYKSKSSVTFSMHCTSTLGGQDCIAPGTSSNHEPETVPGWKFGGYFTLYRAPSNYKLEITESSVNTITAKHSWTNGSATVSTKTITIGSDTRSVNNGSSYTFEGLKSNTKYTINGKIYDGTTTLTDSKTRWTYPEIGSLTLSLPSGKEHDEIDALAVADVSSDYDKFSFKLDSNEFSEYSDDANISYSDLEGHSTHSVTVKMKNTTSGYESKEVVKSITTWYDPIYSLSVTLVNKWYWFISTKATFNYQGGPENIKKYEFSIGDESYQDKDTTNAYSKGTTTPGQSNNLLYNTDYICKVKLTDNHGRTKEASATFKTLDERPLYVNGTLREVKVIKPDGSVHYITPNLLSVVRPDNKVINMNKIINNDDRTEYK